MPRLDGLAARCHRLPTPPLAEQRDPYAKGDIKHTNIYNWEEAKVEKAKAIEAKKAAERKQRAETPRTGTKA